MAKKVLITLFVISMCFFTSSAFSADVSTLLEKGIYAEETKGDLDEAMMIYKKIIDENTDNSANIAEAYYRLGTCYLRTGDEKQAIEMFNEILTDFREYKEIASDARAQLFKLNALDEEDQINKPLELGPVPWEAGETSWYNINSPLTANAGKTIHSVKELTIDGNDLWRIEKSVSGVQMYWRSDVLKESLSPVTGKLKSSIMDYNNKAIYKKDHIQFVNTAKEKNDIPVGDIVYDQGQTWEIIRRLPLTENYSASYNVFNLMRGQITNLKLTVTGVETVTVPAGTFECYCVHLDSDSNTKSKIWISISDKKYIVKSELQSNTFELEKVARVTVEKPAEFHDSELGISMSAPKGWHFVKSSITAPYKIVLEILSPELKAVPAFLIADHFGIYRSPQDIPKLNMGVLEKSLKNYTPRPESWVSGEIDGLPSLSYIADYDDKDKKMIEYRTYILDKKQLGLFSLNIEKETFDEIKTDVDSIVKSFKWKKKAQVNTNPSEMKLYENDEYKFSLKIPEDWTTMPPVPSNSREEVVRFVSNNGYDNNLIIVYRGILAWGQSLKKFRDDVERGLASAGYGNFRQSEITIGSEKVPIHDFDKPIDYNRLWSCRHCYIADGTTRYTLALCSTDWDSMVDLYDRISKTFRTE